MKKLIIALALLAASLLPTHLRAQTRLLFGVAGTQAYDNSNIGVSGSLEIPFLSRYELDLKDTFSPLESHVSLGGGRSNTAYVGAHIWLSKSWGLQGGAEDSAYNVTRVSKDADYAFGGLAWRGILGGAPTRFSFEYVRQFNNGIAPSGVESSHLQGGDIGFTMRFGCVGAICVRNSEDFEFGRVLTQGNPVCDGTFGVTGGNGPNGSCPRSSALGGGVTASVSIEFPRRRGHEHDIF